MVSISFISLRASDVAVNVARPGAYDKALDEVFFKYQQLLKDTMTSDDSVSSMSFVLLLPHKGPDM